MIIMMMMMTTMIVITMKIKIMTIRPRANSQELYAVRLLNSVTTLIAVLKLIINEQNSNEINV